MNRCLLVLCTLLFFLCQGKAQSRPQLPESWTGYFQDEENRLVFLQPDFFYLDDLMPKGGYFEKIESDGGTATAFFREFAGQSRLPNIVLRKQGERIQLELNQYGNKILLLRRFDPQATTRSVERDLSELAGTWYCGEDGLEVRIDGPEVNLGGVVYQVQDAFQYITENRSGKYYLLGGGDVQQLISRPLELNEQYFAWRVLNRRYEHCRRDPAWPYFRSLLYPDLGYDLTGRWESEDPEALALRITEDYQLQWGDRETHIRSISRSAPPGDFRLEAKFGQDRKRWQISLENEAEIRLKDLNTENESTYRRQDKPEPETSPDEAEEAPVAEPVEKEDFTILAFGIAIGLLIAIVVILRVRQRRRKQDQFV